MILPEATLGVLGGGQLGRMFTMAARTLGYRVVVLDPDPHSPAGSVADEQIIAPYADEAALTVLAGRCAAVTTEFENVPAASLDFLADRCLVRPGAAALRVAQDRIQEKTWLRGQGFATAPFAVVRNRRDLEDGFAGIGGPALLKVSRFGYDGKGQARVDSLEEVRTAFRAMGEEACVLEGFLPLDRELSVVLARGCDGEIASFPVAENQHENGILDLSIVPARVGHATAQLARDMAESIARKLDYIGVLAVEFFLLSDGSLRINEIAPRPHNSGHYTLDACLTDQFEQQVRALCGLPLGDTRLLSPVVMLNLLGDVWCGERARWEAVFREPAAKLHLYGKREARAGRKMGHVNVLAEDVDDALSRAEALRRNLACPDP
ncbi:5-(carboxyamino)imidazole ribonucleotide synthase [Thermithiobacillus plumbiphilus]|uniref:N5-carboxyaminoimidazole ribonucleotide synthase n=1 Tax=Thermithiobacillus plumbiphilus TaxID=1729899 RepID=A0ABU9DAI1_9PROT